MGDSTNNKTWFILDNLESLFENEKGSKPIYRIIPFDSLLQMFSDKVNILVQTNFWEDVYENFLFKANITRNKKRQGQIFLNTSNRFYGQCWTERESSDALWRIYSPDRKSVRIKTTLDKILSICPEENDGDYFLGKVKYYSKKKIEDDILSLGPLNSDQFTSILLQSFFCQEETV